MKVIKKIAMLAVAVGVLSAGDVPIPPVQYFAPPTIGDAFTVMEKIGVYRFKYKGKDYYTTTCNFKKREDGKVYINNMFEGAVYGFVERGYAHYKPNFKNVSIEDCLQNFRQINELVKNGVGVEVEANTNLSIQDFFNTYRKRYIKKIQEQIRHMKVGEWALLSNPFRQIMYLSELSGNGVGWFYVRGRWVFVALDKKDCEKVEGYNCVQAVPRGGFWFLKLKNEEE